MIRDQSQLHVHARRRPSADPTCVVQMGSTCIPLGEREDITYGTIEAELSEGDDLVMYSNGIPSNR